MARRFAGFRDAARANAPSRVYAGIHFTTATRDGLKLGGKIGRFAFAHYLEPVK
jgi:hypothetical protein